LIVVGIGSRAAFGIVKPNALLLYCLLELAHSVAECSQFVVNVVWRLIRL
jgi:hypothetical protein